MANTVQHRMSTAKINIVDENGQRVSGKEAAFKLDSHEFLFGCGGFDALIASNDIPPKMDEFFKSKGIDAKPFYTDRVNKWMEVFNYTTLPFYWGQYEPQEGNIQFENRMNAVNTFVEKGVKVKGHPLCWHTVCADWLMQYDNKTIMEKQLARIDRDVTAFKGKVDIWDVINETVIMPEYDRYDNAVTRICKEYGRTTLIKEVFAAARNANPNATLLINDFNLSEKYREVISECLDAGVQIDAIGIQTHQHQGYRGMDWLNDILKRFSEFGLPLHFTENTLVSGDIMPAHIVDLNDWQPKEWPSTPEGEERQCREWEEMTVRLFEEPLVEAITGWDFADGAWLNAPSGIIRRDNTLKPSYFKLKELAHERWDTNEKLMTDAQGSAALTGYRGRYTVKVGDKTGSFVLDKNSNEITVVIK